MSPVSPLLPERDGKVAFPGFELALENGYRVAATVIRTCLAGALPPPAS